MITLETADQLDALGYEIFTPSGATGTGLHSADATIDARLAALIAEPMLRIDGRQLATGFKYTLNVTNALQLRAKHWYMQTNELDASSFWPCIVGFEFHPSKGMVSTGTSSFGYSLGLAACAAICHVWASVIRMWLAGEYPLAVSQS